MKQQLNLKYYGRYVDDIVVVHPDLDYLKTVIVAARKYLATKLMLQLHLRKIYLQHFIARPIEKNPVSSGITAKKIAPNLGFFVLPPIVLLIPAHQNKM